MDETKDQVQEDSQESTSPDKVERLPDQDPEEQSETTKDVAEEAKPTVYKDHLGRELTGEQLHEEYTKTQSYITRLEADKKKWEESAQKEASELVSENELLKNVDPNVQAAIVNIMTPVLDARDRQKEAKTQKRAADEAFTKRLEECVEKYKGGDGLPKFDRVKVLAAMQESSNSIYDPEAKFKQLHEKDFIDYYVKQAIKGKSADIETEDTGSTQPRKPGSDKTPKNWDEAAKRALSRL